MPVTEVLNHPLVAEIAENRDVVHMQHTMDGCENIVQYIYEDKSVSNSRAYFTAKPPLGSIIDRQILVELTVDVSVTGTSADHPAFGDYFCPKALPMNRAIDTCQVMINQQSIMSEPGRIVEVMSRNKMNQESIKRFRSLSPAEPDAFNRYENYALAASYSSLAAGTTAAIPTQVRATYTGEAAAAGGAGDLAAALGARPLTINVGIGKEYNEFYSPFREAQYSSSDDYEPRASFPYTEKAVVVAAGNTTITRSYTFTEVLMNPFCMIRQGKAAAHVTSLEVNLQFGSNLERIFSQIRAITQRNYTGTTYVASWAGGGTDHLQGTQGANITVNVSKARMILRYATPSVQLSPKQEISLNHFRLNTQSLGTSASWGSDTLTVDFNAVRLSVIPSHVFIYAKPKTSTLRSYNADAFLNISNINVQISNRTGILSNMTEQELYTMSAENGMNLSWPQWHQKVGSALCLGFGKDICGVMPGVREYIDFAFRCTLKNTTYFDHSAKTIGSIDYGADSPANYAPNALTHAHADQSLDWELCVLFVTPQTLTLEDQVGTLEQGFMADEVQDAIQYGPSSETIEDLNMIVGAGFGDWVKRGYHKAHHFVKKYARPAEQFLRKGENLPYVGDYIGVAADAADLAAKAVGTGGMRARLQQSRGRGKAV